MSAPRALTADIQGRTPTELPQRDFCARVWQPRLRPNVGDATTDQGGARWRVARVRSRVASYASCARPAVAPAGTPSGIIESVLGARFLRSEEGTGIRLRARAVARDGIARSRLATEWGSLQCRVVVPPHVCDPDHHHYW